MEIFNVLFKGIEIKNITWAKAFKLEQSARDFIEEYCDINCFKICSTMGWNDRNTFDDYRVEDVKGNTYYFVIYRQSI